jgi:hypothetical protein
MIEKICSNKQEANAGLKEDNEQMENHYGIRYLYSFWIYWFLSCNKTCELCHIPKPKTSV